jgi:hypothetical protein
MQDASFMVVHEDACIVPAVQEDLPLNAFGVVRDAGGRRFWITPCSAAT